MMSTNSKADVLGRASVLLATRAATTYVSKVAAASSAIWVPGDDG